MFRVPCILENAEKYWNLTLSIFKNVEILAVLEWYLYLLLRILLRGEHIKEERAS